MRRERFPQILDLLAQIFALLGGGDARIDDLFRFLDAAVGFLPKVVGNGGDLIQAFSPFATPDEVDFAGIRPLT